MPRIFLLVLLLASWVSVISQTEKTKGSIGVSIPVIWNNSEATFYRLGNPMYPSGKAFSYGINTNYSRTLYKSIYGIVGIGYFKQQFKILRPFDFTQLTRLLYSTESYNYSSVQSFIGIGYIKKINKNDLIKVDVSYNYFYSFRQKYVVYKANNVWQINKKSLPLGGILNFDFGIERNISKKISLGGNFIIPIYTHWSKDEIFFKNGYSNNEQQIARNKFSAGVAVSCYYHF